MMSAEKDICFRGGESYALIDFEVFWNKTLVYHGQKENN